MYKPNNIKPKATTHNKQVRLTNNITSDSKRHKHKTIILKNTLHFTIELYIEFHYKNRIQKLPSLLNKDCAFDCKAQPSHACGCWLNILGFLAFSDHQYFLSTVAVEV